MFLIGAGRGGERVLNHLMPIPSVTVVGVADRDPVARALQIAKNAGLPVFFTDPIEILQKLDVDVDIVFDLTGDIAVETALLQMSNGRFEIATGQVTRLFIRSIIEANEKDNLLKKHLEISLMISQSKTLKRVFDTIVEGGMEITNMPSGFVALFNHEQRDFTLLSHKGFPFSVSQPATFTTQHEGLTEFILSNKTPVMIPDLEKNPPFDTRSLTLDGIRSLVAIPLLSERELLGILFYNNFQPQNFPEGLIDVLNQFALEAVIAIQRQKAIAQVRHLASRDTLTGLYNRHQFTTQLQEAIVRAGQRRADQQNETVSLMICDLDRFKEINETLGHQHGDYVLKQTAESIATLFTEDGPGAHPLLFRTGADEISIIFPNTTSEQLLQKALLIRQAVQTISQKVYFPIDMSIGGAIYPEHSESSDQLIIRASRSLLIAKREDNKICIGAPDNLQGFERVHIIFEPIVDTIKNQVIGHEALSRDVHGKVSILDLFQKYAEWGELDDLKRACFVGQIKKAHELGLSRVFLNVDSRILTQCEWITKPVDIDVVLEISESESIQNVDAYLALAERWREKGFRFAIDDFGAGFISLPFLSRLKPEYIKIDRSVMLRAVASSEFCLFLKKLVAALQGRTSQRMIAEGVETESELQRVLDVDINLVQGFLLKDMGYPILSHLSKD